MTDKELYEAHGTAITQSRKEALQFVLALNLPKTVHFSEDAFSGLGLQVERRTRIVLSEMREKFGDHLPHLVGLALRELWFELFSGSRYCAIMGLDPEGKLGLQEAETYGEYEGFAWALCGGLASLCEPTEKSEFRKGTPFSNRPTSRAILQAAALYWLAASAKARRNADVDGAMKWLYEAHDALATADGWDMWEEGEKQGRECAANDAEAAARSAIARTAAHVRHRENRALKDEAFKWLDNNFLGCKSMDAAAEAMAGKVVPVAFRTARDWVGAWRKQRPASTP